MNKIKLPVNVFDYPMPVTLLGTMIAGKVNFMTLGWITRANANPPMLAIGVGKSHHTHKGLLENREFSINYPGAGMLQATDYCGIYSGNKVDKSGVFEVFYGNLKSAPMIPQCPLNLECRLVNQVDLPTNVLYIGEIVGAYTEEKYCTGGKPDIKKMNTMMLTMPDNSYWTIGERAGSAWKDGAKYR